VDGEYYPGGSKRKRRNTQSGKQPSGSEPGSWSSPNRQSPLRLLPQAAACASWKLRQQRLLVRLLQLKADTPISAPMPGMLVKYEKKVGDTVEVGDTILVLEAMKMYNNIPSPAKGV
jgi:biotin carboxyl carrier protein